MAWLATEERKETRSAHVDLSGCTVLAWSPDPLVDLSPFADTLRSRSGPGTDKEKCFDFTEVAVELRGRVFAFKVVRPPPLGVAGLVA